ncbi:MAG: mannose-1-phosphate guanylyltransferase/mannose-6-phosphate isomerase [Candidatus Gygaella obscura]|nr:mannose-1-phosphate guanylyltransferase/mannose-6-phosphate isomerase [Candidatus Gygaella obscura]
MNKYALVLAGGKGARLWPLSRANYPKQFIDFINEQSLFQLTIIRLLSFFKASDIYFISQDDYEFTIKNQIDQIKGLDSIKKKTLKNNLIFEPCAKNTLAAISLGIRHIQEHKNLAEKDLFYVFPSDHVIEPAFKFKKALKQAIDTAGKDKIVIFGIKPKSPKQGYGYVLTRGRFDKGYLVERFVEKPSLSKAKALLKKNAYWNSGIFCFNKNHFLKELQKNAPKLHRLYKCSLKKMQQDFDKLESISIDYAIMQKSKDIVLVRFDLNWSDLGSWDSFIEFYKKDKGNVSIGRAEFIDSRGCFARSDKRLISFVGINDAIVVDSSDVVLIVKKGYSDKVKELTSQVEKKGLTHFKDSLTVHRPWGYYTVLHEEPHYKVKEIGIYPKKAISLQTHKYRSEHWNVVEGELIVFVAGKKKKIRLNQSVFVSKSTKHKVYNPGKKISKIIEVQIGTYVGEDDIKRFDKYKA